MTSKQRKLVFYKFGGKCAYSGKKLDTYQIDHVIPKYKFTEGIVEGDPNDVKNLIPCESLLNHYKRGFDLEQFRDRMLTFHLRLAKLPNKTNSPSTQRRKDYMLKIAELMDITPDKPFSGKFYFETL